MPFLLKKVITTAICGRQDLGSSHQNKKSFHWTTTWLALKDYTTVTQHKTACTSSGSLLWSAFGPWQPHFPPGICDPWSYNRWPMLHIMLSPWKNVLWVVGGDLWCHLPSKCWKDLHVEGRFVDCQRKPHLCSRWGKAPSSQSASHWGVEGWWWTQVTPPSRTHS